jgi:hypothetical protein
VLIHIPINTAVMELVTLSSQIKAICVAPRNTNSAEGHSDVRWDPQGTCDKGRVPSHSPLPPVLASNVHRGPAAVAKGT